jgi:hypothetical protein
MCPTAHRGQSVSIAKTSQLMPCKEVTTRNAQDESHKQYVYRVRKKCKLLNTTTTAWSATAMKISAESQGGEEYPTYN